MRLRLDLVGWQERGFRQHILPHRESPIAAMSLNFAAATMIGCSDHRMKSRFRVNIAGTTRQMIRHTVEVETSWQVVVLQSKLLCASFCAPFASLLILIDEQRYPQGDETSLGTLLDFQCLMVVFLRNFVIGVQFDVLVVHKVPLRLRKTFFSAEISFSKCVLNVYKWLATCDLHLRYTSWTRVKYKSDSTWRCVNLHL